MISAFGVEHGDIAKSTRRRIHRALGARADNIIDEVDVALGRKEPWQAKRRPAHISTPPIADHPDMKKIGQAGKKIVLVQRAKKAGAAGAVAGSGFAGVKGYDAYKERKKR